jgi:RluA family pseudouridine synthase
MSRARQPPSPLPLTILFEDEGLIAVDKPAGLLVVPDRFDERAPTLFDAVWNHLARGVRASGGEESAKPRLIHRLDRDTSGVVLFAKTIAAQRTCSRAFEAGLARKIYLALVDGSPSPPEGTIDLPLGPAPKLTRATRGRMYVEAPGAKTAITDYRTLERYSIEAAEGACEVSLLEARPRTGRTHQIRVHLAAIGHPLCADPRYGARETFDVRGIRVSRTPLHATVLEVAGRRFEAPLPADFAEWLRVLRH